MPRRPRGHVALPPRCLLALAVLLPWGPIADALQQHGQPAPPAPPVQIRSPAEHNDHAASDPTTTPMTDHGVIQTPVIQRRRRNTLSQEGDARSDRQSDPVDPLSELSSTPYDVRALALDTLQSVRATPSSRQQKSGLSGLTSPSIGRRLEDWKIEDFVLLATVNGNVYASDRRTGDVRWILEVDHPVVETKHYAANRSAATATGPSANRPYHPVDHYLWVIEPHRDGRLYLWVSDDHARLVETPYSMKQIVEELAPHNDKERNLLYTGDKKTTLVTLDAATGRVVKWFGAAGSQINQEESCFKPNTLEDVDSRKCAKSGTLTLGRTEYTVSIHHDDGYPIATLKYLEWGPNTFDNDLIQQHVEEEDKHYITTRHDGSVSRYDYGRYTEDSPDHPSFAQKLESPVARVFDVLRRWDDFNGDFDHKDGLNDNSKGPDLTVLPQPPPPAEDEEMRRLLSENVFINQTEDGGWYALSGMRYPLVLQAPRAAIDSREWWELQGSPGMADKTRLHKALVGVHRVLPAGRSPGSLRGAHLFEQAPLLTLPDASSAHEENDVENDAAARTLEPVPPEPSRLLETAKKAPELAIDNFLDMIKNPVFLCLLFVVVWAYKRELRRYYHKVFRQNAMAKAGVKAHAAQPEINVLTQGPAKEATALANSGLLPGSMAETQDGAVTADAKNATDEDASEKETPALPVIKETRFDLPDSDEKSGDGSWPDTPGCGGPPERKKARARGRRGGVKHKKGKDKREMSLSRDDDVQSATVEDAVSKAKHLGEQPKLEPDIQTVTAGDVEEVSGPILKMGSLEVDTDRTLGTGSNGTVVFAGKWEGRHVAIKRMLVQFNEIASQETKLLRESDSHAHVIRYFAQQQRQQFLYIALELCQASLAEVVQSPHKFRTLAQAGERDMQGILYQVADGLSHLHSLRIVHRDLKPQNILVTMTSDGRPRMVVSDFGLCKKLEATQSSFGATTAHAAGTSGWRAPELLVDDDGSTAAADPSSSLGHSGSASGSTLPSADMMPGVNPRRVTRAIDIFSLGLVFFYVLTKGSHPFDCGDRYMREVNIRKGKFSLHPLDALGDFAHEAHDLIGSMLRSNARDRPDATEVKSHPFFWSPKRRLSFLCDVSDSFEKEPREPPSEALQELERWAPIVVKGDFLRHLPRDFVESLGKQRKYTGTRMLDLLRALRNKKNHYDDMPAALREKVGPLPSGYLSFWTSRFPNLLIACWNVVERVGWEDTARFKEYWEPARLGLQG